VDDGQRNKALEELFRKHLLSVNLEREENAVRDQQRRAEADVLARKEKELRELTERKAVEEASASAVRALKLPANKESASWLLAAAGVGPAGERTALVRAMIETTHVLEENGRVDLEEANAMLETATKKVTSLNKEQQEELYKTIKIKKRSIASLSKDETKAGMRCPRCSRVGHGFEDCHATTMVDNSTPCEVALHPNMTAKRANTQAGYAARSRWNGGAYPAYSGGYDGAGQAFGQTPFPFGGSLAYGGAPPPLSAPPPWRGPPGPRLCHICQSPLHIAASCPSRNAPGMQGPAGVSSAVSTTQTEHSTHGQATTMNVSASSPMLRPTHPVVAHVRPMAAVAHVDVPSRERAADRRSREAQQQRRKNETYEIKQDAGARSEESFASMYIGGEWEVAAEADGGEEGAREEKSEWHARTIASAAATPSTLGQANMSHNSKSVPSASNCVHEREAAVLHAVEWTGMPSVDVSLRRMIAEHFHGKKKILSEVHTHEQVCERCAKRGHEARACPDQTQREEQDASDADRWVRKLLKTPRVCIAEVNRGLTLEQGMTQWLKRGREMNKDNPWVGSTRKEDALRAQLGYHKAMGMSAVHLGWIGFGVPLHFVTAKPPAPIAFRNHRSAMEEAAFVDAEHEANSAAGSYVEVHREQLRGICPLQVEKNSSGKLRLCQDLRWINGHLPNVEFRMESLHTELGDVVQPADKLLTTDIEKAYYCLPLHPDAQAYLGWQWRGKYYMPTCLVFGLSTAPRIFTKIMRPMMAFMRSLGVRVLGMIDDYMWAAKADKMKGLREAVKQVMTGLGWKLNAKCVWEPSDEVLMLGMLINTKEFVVKAPSKKIQAAHHNIRKLMAWTKRARGDANVRLPNLRAVQRVTGQLMSMMLALPAVRVFTRALYRCIAVAQGEVEAARMHGTQPSYEVRLSDEAMEELTFWSTRVFTHNALTISSRENQIEVLLWSDASDVGWGGEAMGVQAGSAAALAGSETQQLWQPTTETRNMEHGGLPFAEIATSSTRRELVGLLELAKTPTILEQLKQKRVKIFMDSQPALCNLINGGGPKPDLTSAVQEWTKFCELHAIKAVYEWVPRAANWRADKASKLHAQQYNLRSTAIENRIREGLGAQIGSERVRMERVPMFLPMFHQVDARVEMIRAGLLEAIIVVPVWPAGASNDWYRRVEHHSIGSMAVGTAKQTYIEAPQTGHDEQLRAFWLPGRRSTSNRS
jgi:hypothetical protein